MWILIFFFILQSYAQAMQPESFWVIDDDQLYTAIKVYGRGDQEVHFMATFHFGEKAYYQALSQYIKDNVVIYELKGCTYSQKEEWDKEIQNLGTRYHELYKNIRRLQEPYELAAFHFGLSLQIDELDLGLAKKLIHADFVASQKNIGLYKDSNKIIRHFEAIREEIKAGSNGDLKELVQEKAATIGDIKIVINQAFYAKDLNDDDDFKLRNEGVVLAMKKAMEEHAKFVVLYGALHQNYFASFLEQEGFVLKGIKWLPVISFNQPRKL